MKLQKNSHVTFNNKNLIAMGKMSHVIIEQRINP